MWYNIYINMHNCEYIETTPFGVKITKGQCDHTESEHRNGTCWHIVDPNLEDKDTIKKYCKCVKTYGNIKPFSMLGYTEIGTEDWMIPTFCEECNKNSLMRIGQNICLSCQVIANFK